MGSQLHFHMAQAWPPWLIHIMFQFKNLQELSLELLRLCGPHPTVICVHGERGLCGGHSPLSRGDGKSLWRCGGFYKTVLRGWGYLQKSLSRSSNFCSLLKVPSYSQIRPIMSVLSLSSCAGLTCGLASASWSLYCSFRINTPICCSSYFDRIIPFSDPSSSFPLNDQHFFKVGFGVSSPFLRHLSPGVLGTQGLSSQWEVFLIYLFSYIFNFMVISGFSFKNMTFYYF